MITLLIVSLCLLARPLIAKTPSVESEISLTMVSDTDKYAELIEALNCCENYCRWDMNKIVDSNGYYSYGGLMFQAKTLLYYGQKYSIVPPWVDIDYIKTVIYDRDLQTRVAIEMIKNGLGPTTHGWYNCWKSHNLDQYLDN